MEDGTAGGRPVSEDGAEACLSAAPVGYGESLEIANAPTEERRASSAQRRPQEIGRPPVSCYLGRTKTAYMLARGAGEPAGALGPRVTTPAGNSLTKTW